jgi:hypothetical protein
MSAFDEVFVTKLRDEVLLAKSSWQSVLGEVFSTKSDLMNDGLRDEV